MTERPEPEHYFTAEPVSDGELRERTIELAGHTVTVHTAGGVFSPGDLDKGTAVLLRSAPPPPADGTFLDLGCGWGPLALTLALASPQATVYAVDVSRRALDLTRRNADRLGCAATLANGPSSGGGIVTAEPDGVPDDVTFDLIWSNPPIRVGKQALHEMLVHWLPRLAPGGTAYLVVSKNLGADSLQTWLTTQLPHADVSRHASSKGFRVLAVHAGA
ncbi:MAG: class I SAM-dependent methyltransferase [Ornithinimicrobium sp.]|uniref:class I SAM-dependent methyltransferase n=1 Tax=Ornithinimicrobium sp. TaxID=1977084 RepID=UPI003D9BFAAD